MSLRVAASFIRSLTLHGCTKGSKQHPLTCSTRSIHLTAMHACQKEGTELEKHTERVGKATAIQLLEELATYKEAKDKETFIQAVEIYEKHNSVHKRGHTEFILGSLEKMKDFNVHKDPEVYKELMKVFPEGKMVPRNLMQYEFMHYPKQQNAAIKLLSKMTRVGCQPDDQMGDIIISRFGKHSYVMKFYQRIMYWMPKFRHMNPYPVPYHLPKSAVELAILALKRMAVDPQNKVTLYQTETLKEASDKTFVASAFSPEQMELVSSQPVDRPIYVEGGYTVWLRDQSLTYFILRADPPPDPPETGKSEPDDEEIRLYTYLDGDAESVRDELMPLPSRHEQPEGFILAMCITGTSSKDSLNSWVSFLQREMPDLSKYAIVFSLRTPESGLDTHQQQKEEPVERLSTSDLTNDLSVDKQSANTSVDDSTLSDKQKSSKVGEKP